MAKANRTISYFPEDYEFIGKVRDKMKAKKKVRRISLADAVMEAVRALNESFDQKDQQ